MTLDPISGPLSRQQLAELVKAPYGECVKVIRKYDPQYGRQPGEKFRWKITARCEMDGVGYVMASDENEAAKLADEMADISFDWSARWPSDMEIISVKPENSKD